MISPENKSFVILLSVLVLAFLGIWASPDREIIDTEKPLTQHIDIQGGTYYSNNFILNQASPKLKLRVVSTEPVYIKLQGAIKHCDASPCEFVQVVNYSTDKIPFEIYSDKDTVVTEFEFKVVKYKNITTLDSVTFEIWGFAALALLSLLIFNFIFYDKKILNQWLIIILTMAFIAATDLSFALILIAFLTIMYRTRRMFLTSKGSKLLYSTIIASIFFLLLWKYGKEGIYGIFANPGDFNLLMPLGISYFIIRLIDTLLRWFRHEMLDIEFRDFLLFIIFPGTLIAGPIENIKDFYEKRIDAISYDDIGYGLGRILIGLFKKLVVADLILYPSIHGETISKLLIGDGFGVNVLLLDPSAATGIGIMAFAVSGLIFAYVDFSAYSDIAIGLSRLFGYKICENFNYPILAPNIREYWKRWHMSLSNWSFRNVYFPALVKTRNSYLPLYLTMMVIGLWHSFSFSWYFWAIHHATGMSIVSVAQKYTAKLPKAGLPIYQIISTMTTIIFASLGFVFVYFNDFEIASELYLRYWVWLAGFGN